jgi:hypothetical protein
MFNERVALVSPIQNRRASVREGDYTDKWLALSCPWVIVFVAAPDDLMIY